MQGVAEMRRDDEYNQWLTSRLQIVRQFRRRMSEVRYGCMYSFFSVSLISANFAATFIRNAEESRKTAKTQKRTFGSATTGG